MDKQTILGTDNKLRCEWTGITQEFIDYHDNEWGFPVNDDYQLFEKLCLESFQSGLSWRTILNKRENFRKAFCDFNFNEIAKFTDEDKNRLLQDASIVRHRGKIEAVINNAQKAQELIKKEGSLASYFWQYEAEVKPLNKAQWVSTSEQSIQLSKDLKKLGWKFLGPTTVYAFMQAMGIINDHVEECIIHQRVDLARNKFKRPN